MNDDHTWLKSIEVGQPVHIEDSCFGRTSRMVASKVRRVTKTMVETDDLQQFRRSDGRKRGAVPGSSWRTRIVDSRDPKVLEAVAACDLENRTTILRNRVGDKLEVIRRSRFISFEQWQELDAICDRFMPNKT